MTELPDGDALAPTTGAAESDRSVLLTVDDDPSVSRVGGARPAASVRRAAPHRPRRIRRRGDGGAARAEAPRRHRWRSLLADYRMPEMNGIEFLEQAMDLFPQARRALLTAYADTDAAISAINLVDVDHYLLKPWDPPEEKLYPVLDEMIEAFAGHLVASRCTRRRSSVTGGRRRPSRSGTSWPATPCPTAGTAVDEPEGQRLLARPASARTGCRWSSHRTARRWWRRRRPRSPRPSACRSTRRPTSTTSSSSAAARPASARPSTEPPRDCGRCSSSVRRPAARPGSPRRIENYLGFPDGVSGAQLADRARRQATKFGAEILTARDVRRAARRDGPARVVRFGDGVEVGAHAVILATGVSYRDLACAGADDLTGRGRLLRLGRDRGRRLRRRRRLHRRRRQLRRPGRGVLLPGAPSRSRCWSAADALEESMSHYLIEQLARDRQRLRALCTRRRRGARRRTTWRPHPVRTPDRARPSGSTPATPSSSSARSRAPTGWTAPLERDDRGFLLDRAGPARGRPPPARLDRWTATRGRWRRASPACSWPETYARTRSSGSPRPSARARWPSRSRTATWARHERRPRPTGVRLTHGRAARAVPVRVPRRRAAGLAGRARLGRGVPGRRRRVFGEGEPAELVIDAAVRARISMSRRVGPRRRRDRRAPTSVGVYAGAMQSYFERRARCRSTPPPSARSPTPGFFVLARARPSATRSASWFPMAIHLLEGLFLGHAQLASRSSASASSCSPSARCRPG